MSLQKILAFLQRDFKTESSYRLAFLMRFVGVFLSVSIFFFVSKLFGQSVSAYLKPYGGNYFAFVLIGLAFSGFLSLGLNSFSSSINTAQSQGTLEAMLVTPTSLSAIVILSSAWNFVVMVINVIVYLLMGSLVFGLDLTHANFAAALLALGLTVITFSSIGIISASFIIVFKRGDPINWVFGSLSGLMGGTFFPVTVLPAWLQKFSVVFPVFYSLRAMRLALLKGHSVVQLGPDILALAVFCLILAPLSIFVFKRAVIRAKIDGTLGTY